MNKKDATIKARAGMTAGDLRAILNKEQIFAGSYPSKANKSLTKYQTWNILHGAIANIAQDAIVDADVARNILWEFAP